MFTKTDDYSKIALIKYSSKELKTLPSIQLECVCDSEEFTIAVVAMNWRTPLTRLTVEAMFVSAMGEYSEEELKDVVFNQLVPNSDNRMELIKILQGIRLRREESYVNKVSLNVSVDTLRDILTLLEDQGNLSFVVGKHIENVRSVPSLDDINDDLIRKIYQDNYQQAMSLISYNSDYMVALGQAFFPEDSILNVGTRTLAYMNQMTGGAYDQYETLQHAYQTDPHFKANPDFFSTTTCECGGELVVRKNDYNEYTLMSCINPYCFEKMAFSLADFARAMGVDGLGATTLMELTKSVAAQNCVDMGDAHCDYTSCLRRENKEYLGLSAGKLWIEFIDKIESYEGTTKDLILAMNLPYMGESAGKILTIELLSNPELNANMLLAESKRSGKHDIKFVLNMWLYIQDFKTVVLCLAKSLNHEVVIEYPIYITKGVLYKTDEGDTLKMSKNKFIDVVNAELTRLGAQFRVKLKKSLTQECRALIADTDRNTGSCARANSYGVPIYTSREFVQSLGGASNES